MASTTALQTLLSGVRGVRRGSVRAGSESDAAPNSTDLHSDAHSLSIGKERAPLSSAGALPDHLDFFRDSSGPRKRRRPGNTEADDDNEELTKSLAPLLGDDERVARAMIAQGAGVLTEVQRKVFPLMREAKPIAEHPQDVIAVAPTGSGKTLCYAAPLAVCVSNALSDLKRGVSAPADAHETDDGDVSSAQAQKKDTADELRRLRSKLKKRRKLPPELCPSSPKDSSSDANVSDAKMRKSKKRMNSDSEHSPRRHVQGAETRAVSKPVREGPPTPICLILVPTRELASQVGGVFSRLLQSARIPGRVVILASKASLSSLGGARIDVLVATPARARVALERRLVDLGGPELRHVVLDEADRLLDDGFIEQVDEVLASCNSKRHSIHAFSATLAPSIEDILRGLARNPVKVVVGGGGYGGAAAVTEVARLVQQEFKFVGGKGEQGKVLAVRNMLQEGLAAPILVFVQSKDRAADLFRELVYDGVHVDAIHADRSGAARSSAIARFRAGSLPVLIATDLLARGLDFRAVSTVLNYDMPASAAAYIHRIGRTGRAGRRGTAVTLFTEEDAPLLHMISRVARSSGATIPDWMLAQRKLRPDQAARMERRPIQRSRVGGSALAGLPRRHRKARVPGRRSEDENSDEGPLVSRGGENTDPDDSQ